MYPGDASKSKDTLFWEVWTRVLGWENDQCEHGKGILMGERK